MKEFNFLSASRTDFAMLILLPLNLVAWAMMVRPEQSEHEAPGDSSPKGEWLRLQRTSTGTYERARGRRTASCMGPRELRRRSPRNAGIPDPASLTKSRRVLVEGSAG